MSTQNTGASNVGTPAVGTPGGLPRTITSPLKIEITLLLCFILSTHNLLPWLRHVVTVTCCHGYLLS